MVWLLSLWALAQSPLCQAVESSRPMVDSQQRNPTYQEKSDQLKRAPGAPSTVVDSSTSPHVTSAAPMRTLLPSQVSIQAPSGTGYYRATLMAKRCPASGECPTGAPTMTIETVEFTPGGVQQHSFNMQGAQRICSTLEQGSPDRCELIVVQCGYPNQQSFAQRAACPSKPLAQVQLVEPTTATACRQGGPAQGVTVNLDCVREHRARH